MRIIYVFLILIPFFGYSQNENKTTNPTYTDTEVAQYVIITQNWVTRPISDHKITQIIEDADMTLEEYKALLTIDNFGLESNTKTQPQSEKEKQLAILITEKNKEKTIEKEKLLAELCEKHLLDTAKYHAINTAIKSDETLKRRVIEVLNK